MTFPAGWTRKHKITIDTNQWDGSFITSVVPGGIAALDKTELLPIMLQVVNMILYCASTAVLFWFSTRPPKPNRRGQ